MFFEKEVKAFPDVVGKFVLKFRAVFLDAFAKLLKATITFFLSVRPSLRMEQLRHHWKDFRKIGSFFENMSRKFKLQ
jgi:hypothetical protein